MAIQSFAEQNLQLFFETGKLKKKAPWGNIRKIVMRKLDMLHYSHVLTDLRSPPGNHLEALRGDLAGLYSIRINDQWRCVFQWGEQGPEKVCIMDYHN